MDLHRREAGVMDNGRGNILVPVTEGAVVISPSSFASYHILP